jgi:hypothetical protein
MNMEEVKEFFMLLRLDSDDTRNKFGQFETCDVEMDKQYFFIKVSDNTQKYNSLEYEDARLE